MLQKLTVFALLSTTVAANAALPPYWQRTREIQTIAESADVADALAGHGMIDAIRFVSPDRYEVQAGSCVLQVRIADDTSVNTAPGPRRFTVEPGKLNCK